MVIFVTRCENIDQFCYHKIEEKNVIIPRGSIYAQNASLQIMLSFYKSHQTVTATEEQKTSTKLTLDWDKSRAGLRLLVVY